MEARGKQSLFSKHVLSAYYKAEPSPGIERGMRCRPDLKGRLYLWEAGQRRPRDEWDAALLVCGGKRTKRSERASWTRHSQHEPGLSDLKEKPLSK